MPELAENQGFQDPADMTGLDDFFSSHDKPCQEDLTLDEAAKRLNLSERTIQRRLKLGQLMGYKVHGPRGPEWRISLKSSEDTTEQSQPSTDETTEQPQLSTVKTTTARVDTTIVNAVTTDEAIIEIHGGTELEEDRFQTETTTEPDWNQVGRTDVDQSGSLDRLVSIIESQSQMLKDASTKLESANYRIGYLEAQTQNYQEKIKLLTDSQHKEPGWWQRFCTWFLNGK